MVLKNQVEWAIHCCGVLAVLPSGKYLATKDLAEFHGVPKEYLSKALQALSQAGLVLTTLGPTGGYRLSRAPNQITFLDIVEAVQGNGSTFVCTEIRKKIPCKTAKVNFSKPCAVARVMYDADEAWRAHLKSVKVSDLVTTLKSDLPADVRAAHADWIGERI